MHEIEINKWLRIKAPDNFLRREIVRINFQCLNRQIIQLSLVTMKGTHEKYYIRSIVCMCLFVHEHWLTQ